MQSNAYTGLFSPYDSGAWRVGQACYFGAAHASCTIDSFCTSINVFPNGSGVFYYP